MRKKITDDRIAMRVWQGFPDFDADNIQLVEEFCIVNKAYLEDRDIALHILTNNANGLLAFDKIWESMPSFKKEEGYILRVLDMIADKGFLKDTKLPQDWQDRENIVAYLILKHKLDVKGLYGWDSAVVDEMINASRYMDEFESGKISKIEDIDDKYFANNIFYNVILELAKNKINEWFDDKTKDLKDDDFVNARIKEIVARALEELEIIITAKRNRALRGTVSCEVEIIDEPEDNADTVESIDPVETNQDPEIGESLDDDPECCSEIEDPSNKGKCNTVSNKKAKKKGDMPSWLL